MESQWRKHAYFITNSLLSILTFCAFELALGCCCRCCYCHRLFFSLFLLLCKYTTGNAFFFFCFFCNSIPIYSLLFGVPLFLLPFKHFIYSFLTSFPSVRSSIVILHYGSVTVRPYSKNSALVKTHKTNEQSHEERQNSACKNFNYSQTMHRVFCVHCAGNG